MRIAPLFIGIFPAEGPSYNETLPDRKDSLEIIGRPRDDVDAYELTDPAGRCGTGIGGSLDGADVAADQRGNEPGINLLPTYEHDIGGFQHRVRGFNHADEALGLDHAERITYMCLVAYPGVTGFGHHVRYQVYQPSRRRSDVIRKT